LLVVVVVVLLLVSPLLLLALLLLHVLEGNACQRMLAASMATPPHHISCQHRERMQGMHRQPRAGNKHKMSLT
jgi:hypothetical protein